MYSRDPFNLRRKPSPASAANIFRTSSSSSLRHTSLSSETSSEFHTRGTHAQHPHSPADGPTTNMTSSYGLPNGHYSHANGGGGGGVSAGAGVGTLAGENVWQASQASSRARHTAHGNNSNNIGAAIGEQIGDMLGAIGGGGRRKDSLPYYKDKPYQHPGKGRQRSPLPRWLQQRRTAAIALVTLTLFCWWLGLFSSGKAKTTTPAAAPATAPVASKPKSKGWFSSGPTVDWNARADTVRDAFKLSYAGYEKYGWGYDEYHPVSHTGKHMTPKGMGWIIIDALDTMMVMNLTTELTHARQWIHSNLTYDQDHDVNTFETTIRMLGGLLSAHYLSTAFPGVYAPVDDGLSDDMYVEKAADLADRLLAAYQTRSGVPLASVNLHTYQGIPSHADGGASSTAEATTVQLEMKYLAKLTGEAHYWEHAENVMKVISDNEAEDGLVPIFVYADQGIFRGSNIRLGSRGDSYYEYLIKQYLQTSMQEPIYQGLWNESLAGVKKHLITYSYPDNYTVLAERPAGLGGALSAKMDHLVCFMPGTIALATTGGATVKEARARPGWGPQQEEDLILAEELMRTCMGMYAVTPTGLAPEIAHFAIYDPPLMYNDFKTTAARPRGPESFEQTADHGDYQIHAGDVHNLQRPETVESLFYMWRITRNPLYREWGWQIFQAFVEHTATPDGEGFSSVNNVLQVPATPRDNMESFWLAETLKYFYLLFRDDELLPLDQVVFNTEAHPFPRFELGKLFKTGWKRKHDRSPAELAKEAEAAAQLPPVVEPTPGVVARTVVVTQTQTMQQQQEPSPASEVAAAESVPEVVAQAEWSAEQPAL